MISKQTDFGYLREYLIGVTAHLRQQYYEFKTQLLDEALSENPL